MMRSTSKPEETLAAMRDLWFHTGDYARRDAEGYFYFTGRKKERIRRRGENISSYEIEVELLNKPGCDRSTRSDLARRDLPQLVPERLFQGRHRGVGSRIGCSRLRFGFRGADDVPRAVGRFGRRRYERHDGSIGAR